MALAMPPFNLFPLLWLCLPALVFLLQGTSFKRQAFAVGWGFAFGFFVFGFYWIAASMFVDIKHFWWAVPFSVAGLPAFFALSYGVAAIIARRVGVSGISGALSVGLLWFLTDYARGHFLTGFPWNLSGYAWSGSLADLQSTSVLGIYGLSLLTSLAACLPASLIDKTKTAVGLCVGGIALFLALGIAGDVRLSHLPRETVPHIRLRLVQPNIPQTEKWHYNERETHFQDLLALSTAPGDLAVTHIFWPETASPYYLTEDAVARRELASTIPSSATLITGVIRRDMDENGNTHFYNSLIAVDGMGRVTAGYDKSHLVPFGEFMPLRRLIPLPAIAASAADFSAGSGVRSLRVFGLPPFSPLICYEAIFPNAVVDREDRPGFLVNATNDGWFGKTTGPYQHFAIVRVRAIEEGLPLLRIANTGISGVIDSAGRVVKKLKLGENGFIDSDLPTALPETFFARWGELPLWSCVVGVLFVILFLSKKRKKGS